MFINTFIWILTPTPGGEECFKDLIGDWAGIQENLESCIKSNNSKNLLDLLDKLLQDYLKILELSINFPSSLLNNKHNQIKYIFAIILVIINYILIIQNNIKSTYNGSQQESIKFFQSRKYIKSASFN